MILTLLDIPHADDLEYPITGPGECVYGPRDTLWAEDEQGRTWTKEASDDRWHPCVRFVSEPA